MKHFTFIFFVLLGLSGVSLAQNQKILPSSIFIIDQQSGAQVPANSEAAISFKNALIALVSNTNTAKLQQTLRFGPGKRSFFIQQLSPQDNGNAYQISLQRTFVGQVSIVYTFLYNVDQNKLYFSDPNTATWLEEAIQGENTINLNNCQTFGFFNAIQAQPVAVANNVQPVDNGPAVDETAPVDDNVSAPTAPPALPDYEQPECPEDGYLWQPGYWAFSTQSNNYYWVPGVWVAPPTVGFLWTPPYWGYLGGVYAFHSGYWGATIGFYGGVSYGFGYEGVGFVGGDWYGGRFRYNTAVVRVSINVHNTYADARFAHTGMRNHNSFNGPGGVNARPNARELQAEHEHHVMATPEQIRNQRAAREDRGQAAGAGGKPANLANQKAPERVVNGGNGPAGNRSGNGAGNGARNGNPAVAGRPGAAGNVAGPGGQGARPGAPGQAGVRPGMPVGGARPGGPAGVGGQKPGKLPAVNKPASNPKPKDKN